MKTDSGYPRDAGVFFHSRWQTLGFPFALTPIGQPSPVPGDRTRGKRRGFSPGAAARHRSRTRVSTCFSLLFSTQSVGVAVFLDNFPGILKSDVSHPIFSKSDIVGHSCLISNFKFSLIFFARNRLIRVHRPRECNNEPCLISREKVEILSDLGTKCQ